MTEPLRPMSTGQVLDHTFALYRNNFLLFVGIATVGPAANVIFQLLTVGANVGFPFGARHAAPGPGAGPALARFFLGMLFGYIILVVGMALSHAATVKAVAAVYLGRETSVVGAYKALRGRIWSLFGTLALILLFVALAVGTLAIVVMVPLFLGIAALGRSAPGPAGAVAAGLIGLFSIVLIFVVLIAIYVRYALAIQACVVEDLGPWASLKRSVFLSKGSRWRVVAIYLVFVLLGMVLGGGLAAVAGAVGALLHNRIAAAVLIYLAGFIAGSITGPLATIGLSLLYYDERVRKEAFDLQLMMSSLDVPGLPIPVPAQI
jgi:hypothetical protein